MKTKFQAGDIIKVGETPPHINCYLLVLRVYLHEYLIKFTDSLVIKVYPIKDVDDCCELISSSMRENV